MHDKNNDRKLRQQATCELRRLKNNRAVLPIDTTLKDEDIKKHSARALGNIGDKRAIKSL